MEDNLRKLQKASSEYILNEKYNITEELLNYVKKRIESNKNEIEELIKIKKEKIAIKQILNLFELEELIEVPYKNYRNLKLIDGFLGIEIEMPIGVIAVECYDTLETIKYFLQAIKTRNAIVISDVEYDETSVKFLVLLIMKEALKKFHINENLIMILPYEECFYQEFDEVIYTYDKEGNLLKAPSIEKKKFGYENFVYIHSKNLKEEALKNENVIFLQGEFKDIINKIGKQNSAVIYTENSEIAYQFINLVHCKNVFVNTNLINIAEIEDSNSMYYENKNIIFPIPPNEENKDNLESETQEILDLVNKKESIFIKIKNLLKRILK